MPPPPRSPSTSVSAPAAFWACHENCPSDPTSCQDMGVEKVWAFSTRVFPGIARLWILLLGDQASGSVLRGMRAWPRRWYPQRMGRRRFGVVVDEVEELLAEMRREERKERQFYNRRKVATDRGMGVSRYNALRRRQARVECEAWEQAVREYKELMEDMCAKKLAPNLPYMKSLFLGWFEPLRNAIAEEQQLFREGKKKTVYSPYFDQLPPDMMAVITMHKLVSLLMTGGDHGVARVVQAACTIGDAIEQEIRIHHFLEKTKGKRKEKRSHEAGGGSLNELSAKQEKLKMKVSNLLKKQNLTAVKQLVNGQDGLKPWTQEAKAKVGSRLVELLIQTAYIQSSTNQLGEDPPDIRPAFAHHF
ncbi:hypothetical protein MLD38_034717 [Melastoma candidum]|uniref:Uncharacterized protein n=1 Tax=Melastoma candidum TaxID=119954 RepID=A0ACB9MER3_9MYRT|nr:hypothetical protein MLD38_034717 [Melastoma candidum]